MSEWTTVALGEIAHQRKGINYKSEDYSTQDFGHPFITIKCFAKGGGYTATGIKFYDGPSTTGDQLSTGDILLSVTDLTRAGDIVGSPLRVPEFGDLRPALASMDCMRIQPIPELCTKDFLYHRLMLSDVRRQMVAYAAGSTVLHLDTKKVPGIRVRIPISTSLQGRITRVLGAIDTAIERTEALIDKYQQIKAGMMHDLLTRGVLPNGQLRPTSDDAPHLYRRTEIGQLPHEWTPQPLRSLVGTGNIINGPFGSDLLTSELRPEGVPVLYVQDVKPGYFYRISKVCVSAAKADSLAFCSVQRGDILIAKVGSPPCDSCVYPLEERAIVTQDVIRIRPGSKVNAWYLSCLLNSSYGRSIVKRISIEGTRERVSLTEFKDLALPIPSDGEQRLIADRVQEAQRLVTEEIRVRDKLEVKKLGLMQDLLTGKVPVKVDEPIAETTDA